MKDFYALIPLETLRRFINAEVLFNDGQTSLEGQCQDTSRGRDNLNDDQNVDISEQVTKAHSVSCLN
jgi:hypothetical protein